MKTRLFWHFSPLEVQSPFSRRSSRTPELLPLLLHSGHLETRQQRYCGSARISTDNCQRTFLCYPAATIINFGSTVFYDRGERPHSAALRREFGCRTPARSSRIVTGDGSPSSLKSCFGVIGFLVARSRTTRLAYRRDWVSLRLPAIRLDTGRYELRLAW